MEGSLITIIHTLNITDAHAAAIVEAINFYIAEFGEASEAEVEVLQMAKRALEVDTDNAINRIQNGDKPEVEPNETWREWAEND